VNRCNSTLILMDSLLRNEPGVGIILQSEEIRPLLLEVKQILEQVLESIFQLVE